MAITLRMVDGFALTAQRERQGWAAWHGGGSDRQLGGRSGFRVGTPSNALTATSTTWTLIPVSAALDPGAQTHQGMYGWSCDANETGAVTAADQTNPRKDIVYIQVNDSDMDTSGAKSAPVLYLAGTPGTNPQPPALPARSFLVGTITVPQVGGGSPSVVLNPARYVAAGGVLPVADLAERNALTPYVGMQVCRLDRDGWIQTYTGVGTSGWEYQRISRRVYATVNSTNLINETGNAARVIYTMPSTGLIKPYAQTVEVVARAALSCPPIASGAVQEWLCVSTEAGLISNVQGRAAVTFTVSTATVLMSLEASTGQRPLAASVDPLPRMWIDRPDASAVNTTVSADPTFTQMYIDLRPADD